VDGLVDGDALAQLATGPRTELHDRVLAHDWSVTPSGPLEAWSPTLRTATSACLASRIPMLLMIGHELVMLYNDAYSRILGPRHPEALGRTVPDVWSDVWPVIAPLVDATLAGDSTYDEDLPLAMTRYGYEEEAWFTFSYSPVREPDGRVVAVLVTALETTRQVLTARRLGIVQQLGSLPRSLTGSVTEACAGALDVLAGHLDDCPFALAYVLEEDGGGLRLAAGHGIVPDDDLAEEMRGWVHKAVAGRSPVQVSDLAKGRPDVFHLPGGPLGEVDVDTAVTLPLTVAGQGVPIGALVVGTSPRLRLDREHLVFLDLVAGQVAAAVTDARAIALDRERAAERSAAEEARSRYFTEVALTLQRAVLAPTVLPEGFAAHYAPATRTLEVGGDWYDVVHLPDGRYGVVVGDVVGRGLEAAAVMGQLRSAGRALLLESRSPAQVLSALDTFAERTPGAVCSTVFCAVVDHSTGRVRYGSAGHLPAVLAEPDGGTRLLEDAPGLPLALDSGRTRTEADADLAPGATLLLYTDGLVERRHEPLDDGVSRAADVLQAHRSARPAEVAEALTRELLGDFRDDDVAFLVYRRC
jgi:serine phosphatase RsbU (regulator of sigma subunit)